MNTRMRAAALLGVVVLSVVSCTHPPKQPTTLSPVVEISINNNLIPPNVLSIYIRSDAGGRQLLGSVGPNRTETLKYQPVSASDQFRLQGQVTGGRTITSPSFSLINLAGVNWDVNTNSLTYAAAQ